MEGRVSQEEVATGRHVFITLVTDTIPPATHFDPYLLIPRAISAVICVTFRECAPTKALPAQALLDVERGRALCIWMTQMELC